MKKIEASGKTLEIAVQKALDELGLTQDDVDVTVLQEGKRLKPFIVEVSEKLTESARICDFLQNVLVKMGVNCETEVKENGDTICLNVTGDDASHIIGHRGETLDALQYLCSLLLNGKDKNFRHVVLDAEGYRAKREKALQKLAHNLELKVKRTGQPAKLEPMNPYERRIIHTALQSSKYVTTESEGQGNGRHVVISPVGQSDILNAPNAPRKTLNFVYRSEKKRRR